MDGKPAAYVVIGGRDDSLVCSGATLRETVNGLDSPDWGFTWSVLAIRGKEQTPVPKEAYAEPDPPTETEALEFIRDRQAKIDQSLREGRGAEIYRVSGCMRCNCDDPEPKQVQDDIATAAWRLRAEPDEAWWTTPHPEPAP